MGSRDLASAIQPDCHYPSTSQLKISQSRRSILDSRPEGFPLFSRKIDPATCFPRLGKKAKSFVGNQEARRLLPYIIVRSIGSITQGLMRGREDLALLPFKSLPENGHWITSDLFLSVIFPISDRGRKSTRLRIYMQYVST